MSVKFGFKSITDSYFFKRCGLNLRSFDEVVFPWLKHLHLARLDSVTSSQVNHYLIRNRIYIYALFPCLHSLIETRRGLGEFETIMQTLHHVSGSHNFREFSQPSECLDEAM